MEHVTLRIQLMDFHNESLFEQIHSLQVKSFGSFSASLLKNILIDGHSQTVVFGAFSIDDNKLVGVNGFTAHSVHRSGEVGTAYQSCISATDPDYRGKGTFSAIINHAKRALSDAGGAFIFGYPNTKSGPIFTGKLGFSLADAGVVYLGGIWGHQLPFLHFDVNKLSSLLALNRLVQFSARETAIWKAKFVDRQRLFEMDLFTNYAFGRLHVRSIGPFNIRILTLGGYEINKPEIFSSLLLRLGKRAGADLIRVVTQAHVPLFNASYKSRITKTSEPLIVFPLNWNVLAGDVDACTGLKDVY